MIKVFRIDDRLIHGQIVTAWLNYAEAKKIIVIDDDASSNSLRQTLLRMATPKDINLDILSIEDAKKNLNNLINTNILLLCADAKTALEITEITEIKNINVGNQNMKKGKTKFLDNFWLFDYDIENFNKLYNKGINLEFRTVPNDKSLDVYKLINK